MERRLSIRWVKTSGEIDGGLWAECFAPPLEGRWWYEVLERSGLEDQFDFSYAIIEDAGREIGIAPCFLMDVPMDLVAPPAVAWMLRQVGRVIPGVKYQRTLFIGSPCSDEGTVGLRDGVGLAEVALALSAAAADRAKAARAPMVVWKDFPTDAARDLKVLTERAGMFAVASFPGTRAPLPPGGFAGYLASMKSSHRHNLKKKLKRGEALGALVASVIQNPDAATREEIFGLFWQTYEKGTTKFEKLNRRFFEEVGRFDGAHWVLLRHATDNRLAAFMLCFQLGRRAINKFIGLDGTLDGDWYLYFRLWREAVEWASRSGASEMQSGQTGYRAKLDLDHELTPLTNYCRNSNPAAHWVYAKVAAGITWETLDHDLKNFMKSRRGQREEDGK
jgi:hypothetical protein